MSDLDRPEKQAPATPGAEEQLAEIYQEFLEDVAMIREAARTDSGTRHNLGDVLDEYAADA